MSSSSSSSPPSPSSGMSFSIVIIAIVGILATATFLLAYYVFVIKCCLNAHRSEPDHIFRRLSRSRRLLHRHFSSASADSLRGLDPSSIRAIPTFRYGDVSPVPSAVECAVCLLEFRPAERLRRLPGCAHAFHVDCIDTWLESSASCPLCRAEVKLGGFLLDDSVVIEIGEVAAAGKKKKRKIKAGSMGDECVEVRREKDESFAVQPMRRSVSMGSSSDRKLLMAVQEAVRRNPSMLAREGSGGGGRMAQRLLFPFGRCRSSMRLAAAGPPEVMEV